MRYLFFHSFEGAYFDNSIKNETICDEDGWSIWIEIGTSKRGYVKLFSKCPFLIPRTGPTEGKSGPEGVFLAVSKSF
jgi:hypothetical protein